MARPRKPSLFKFVENSRDRRPQWLIDGEPRPQGHLDHPPSWLSEDQAAIWRDVVKQAPYGLLKSLDSSILAAWC